LGSSPGGTAENGKKKTGNLVHGGWFVKETILPKRGKESYDERRRFTCRVGTSQQGGGRRVHNERFVKVRKGGFWGVKKGLATFCQAKGRGEHWSTRDLTNREWKEKGQLSTEGSAISVYESGNPQGEKNPFKK